MNSQSINRIYIVCFLIILFLKLCVSINSKEKNALTSTLESSNEKTSNKETLNSLSNNDFTVIKLKKRLATLYTQGLFYNEDCSAFYESSGLYNQSSLNKIDSETLNTISNVNIDPQYFGEGIAKCGNYIYQLTWKERVILKFDAANLNLLNTIPLDENIKEGWGLASLDGSGNKSVDYVNTLIATDGSSSIYYLDCNQNLKVYKIINVNLMNKDKTSQSIDRLNAIVYAKGFLYANRYFDSNIFKLDIETGLVDKVYDMKNLHEFELKSKTLSYLDLQRGNVLNGIAYCKTTDTFLITGKFWGYYYDIKLS